MDPPDAGKGLLPHRSFHLVPFSRLPLLPSVQIHKYRLPLLPSVKIHKYRLDLFGTAIYSNLCPHLILFGGLRFQMFLSGLWLDFWKRETVETFNFQGRLRLYVFVNISEPKEDLWSRRKGYFFIGPMASRCLSDWQEVQHLFETVTTLADADSILTDGTNGAIGIDRDRCQRCWKYKWPKIPTNLSWGNSSWGIIDALKNYSRSFQNLWHSFGRPVPSPRH